MTQSLATLRAHIRQQVVIAAQLDQRIVGVVDYGSSSEGRADPLSDLDLGLFLDDRALIAFEHEWKTWAAQFGPLLLAYVGGAGHPWTVYDATPLPLRVDFAFHRASALDIVRTWPNAPISTHSMVLYDATDGLLTSYVQQLVGQSLHPTDLRQTFESLCGDFWYYFLRTWTKLLRGEVWAARYDFHFILLGNLVGLLRFEANRLERWRSTSAAIRLEGVLPPHRLMQFKRCIPNQDDMSVRHAFHEAAHLGYEVSAAIAAAHGWTWPKQVAERVLAIVSNEGSGREESS